MQHGKWEMKSKSWEALFHCGTFDSEVKFIIINGHEWAAEEMCLIINYILVLCVCILCFCVVPFVFGQSTNSTTSSLTPETGKL